MRRKIASRRAFPALLVIFLLVASSAGVAAASALDPDITGWATAKDNCDPEPVITYVDQANMTGCGGYTGTITRTWMATDVCGNTAESIQTINITDNTAPIINCPPDTTIECNDSREPSNTGYATAQDNCDVNPVITYTDRIDMSGCGGTITRTWTATDACGNSSQCVQKITIIDNSPPIIYCPPTTTIECDESKDPSQTGYATATDSCTPNPSVTYIDEVNMMGCGGTITRTWTATDACGNIAQCIQVINIVDTTPPVIYAPPDLVIECDELLWTTEPDCTTGGCPDR